MSSDGAIAIFDIIPFSFRCAIMEKIKEINRMTGDTMEARNTAALLLPKSGLLFEKAKTNKNNNRATVNRDSEILVNFIFRLTNYRIIFWHKRFHNQPCQQISHSAIGEHQSEGG
jgi:Cu2+-containing amine oxidase